MLYRLLFLGVNSVTLSKTSFVSTECLALHYGEELRKIIHPSSPLQAFSLTHQKGMEDSVFENILHVVVDNME